MISSDRQTACKEAVAAKAFPAALAALQHLHSMAAAAAGPGKAQTLPGQPACNEKAVNTSNFSALKPSASEATILRTIVQIILDEATAADTATAATAEAAAGGVAGPVPPFRNTAETDVTMDDAAGSNLGALHDSRKRGVGPKGDEHKEVAGGRAAGNHEVHSKLAKHVNSAAQRLRLLGWEAFCGVGVSSKLYGN